jgi:hypothetical protein
VRRRATAFSKHDARKLFRGRARSVAWSCAGVALAGAVESRDSRASAHIIRAKNLTTATAKPVKRRQL